jgi:hypothetical protein
MHSWKMDTDDEKHFEYALGFAIVRRWAALSRETQQLLFEEATAGDDSLREGLATLLHQKHLKAIHPVKWFGCASAEAASWRIRRRQSSWKNIFSDFSLEVSQCTPR